MEPLFEKYVSHLLEFTRINLQPVMYNEQVRAHTCSVVCEPPPLLVHRSDSLLLPHRPPVSPAPWLAPSWQASKA